MVLPLHRPSVLQRNSHSSSHGNNDTHWISGFLALLILFAVMRGLLLLTQVPLVALANNFDQVRYTACFGLYPYRPGIEPTALNYQAPLDHYAFQDVPGQPCYLTSDLLFQGAAVMIFHGSEGLGFSPLHSVRVLGAVRLMAWLLAAWWVNRALLRDGRSRFAVAHGIWLAALAFDPVNTIYLSTFYAEAGALFFAYLTVALIVLVALRPTPLRLGMLALAAAALGLGKIQHLALPLFLATTIAVAARRERRLWQAVGALVFGALPALIVGAWQLQRDTPFAQQLRLVNNADVVLTALLPASDDPARTAHRLGLDPRCAISSGKSVYVLSQPIEQACPGVVNFSRLRALGLGLQEPTTLARMLIRAPGRLLPWIPRYLGLVAGAEIAPLPTDFVTLDRLTDEHASAAWALLLAPLSGFALMLMLRYRPIDAASCAFAAACSAIALSVPCVAAFGDGYVETSKQAHLALNAGAAFVLCAVMTLITNFVHHYHETA